MAELPILTFPDPRLRTKAVPVSHVTGQIRQLVNDMFETMYAAPGIGLAANQVNVHKRIIVVDVSETRAEPHAFINPEVEILGDLKEHEEGCLSIPGFFETVTRADSIRVTALNIDGKPYTLEAHDFLAVCIQHECDHLEGKLFIDYLSSLKRSRIRTKLLKERARNP
jgi:peptide deformylase